MINNQNIINDSLVTNETNISNINKVLSIKFNYLIINQLINAENNFIKQGIKYIVSQIKRVLIFNKTIYISIRQKTSNLQSDSYLSGSYRKF